MATENQNHENEPDLLARLARVEQSLEKVLSLLRASLPPQRIVATVREPAREWKNGGGKTYTCDASQGASRYPFLRVHVREKSKIRDLEIGEKFTFEGEIESYPTQSGRTGFSVFANDIRDENGEKFAERDAHETDESRFAPVDDGLPQIEPIDEIPF